MERTWLVGAAFALALGGGCGKGETASSEAPGAPAQGPAAPPQAPVAPGAPVPGTSVVSASPVAAGGCPATDVTNSAMPGTVHSGRVEGSETWRAAGSPHRLPEGLEITEGAVLTIEPCTRILVGDGQRVVIGGTLLAVGAEARPILFDSGAALPEKGLWVGLHFLTGARTVSKLHYVVVEEAGRDEFLTGAISLDAPFELDAQHVQIVRAKRDGVRLFGTSRFAATATDLVVRESGTADAVNGAVYFDGATTVASLPAGTYTGNAVDAIVVGDPVVATSQTWRNPGVPYRLLEGLEVVGEAGPVLTVAPGTTLAFAAGKNLRVGSGGDGSLVLDGGAEETRIVLTSARPQPGPGDWAGLFIGSGASRTVTRLRYVDVNYAGAADGLDAAGCHPDGPAVIAIEESDLGSRIEHLRVRDVAPTAYGIARTLRAATPTDYTSAGLGNDFAGTRCPQTQPWDAEGGCPDPLPACP